MTRYETPDGRVIDEDELEDDVYETFDEDAFREWVDANYHGFSYGGCYIPAHEVLEVMGDFDSDYRETVQSIVGDYGFDYPTLNELGYGEIDEDESQSRRPRAVSKPKAPATKSRTKPKTADKSKGTGR